MSDSNSIVKKANPLPRRVAITFAISIAITFCTLAGWYISGLDGQAGLDGITVGALTGIGLVLVTTISIRTKERKISQVKLDQRAQEFIQELSEEHLGVVRLLAEKYGSKNYEKLQQDARRKHSIQKEEGNFIFVEVEPIKSDNQVLLVTGHEIEKFRVLRCQSPAVADAIAALLLHLRDDKSNRVPHIYMSWSEVHPLAYALKYAFFGEGETAPLIREQLRRHEPEPNKRPIVHVA